MFFWVNAVQRSTRGAERCTAPSSTCEVQTPELAACQSAPAQAVRPAWARLAWARRPRRQSPLPWPSPTGSTGAGSGSMCLANNAPATCSPLASFNGLAEFGVVLGAQLAPTSRPHLVGVAEVLHCAGCPFGRRLAPPCFVHGQAVEGAIENGAGKSGARLPLDAALGRRPRRRAAGTTCCVAGGKHSTT